MLRSVVAVLLLLCACMANAHEVRPGYLHIQQQSVEPPRYAVLWKQPIVQNRRLAIDPLFPADCTVEDSQPPEVTRSALIHRWLVACDLTQGGIHIQGLSVTLTDVLVRVDLSDGTSNNYILRPAEPTLNLGSDQPDIGLWRYLSIGVEHLVFGIDHVLFVIGLVLFVRGAWTLLQTVTAFTVAHSITLALSVLNVVQLAQGPVEAIIALSILFLARELLQPPAHRSSLTQRAPWIMAFIFGLLHGLGFAGALRDIGLPEDSLWLALLLFNVGIELGQLIIIGGLLAIGWLLRVVWQNLPQAQLIRWSAFGMGCVAAYWTIDRTLILL